MSPKNPPKARAVKRRKNDATVPAKSANGATLRASDPHEWIRSERFTTTGDIPLPELLIDEVIGQDDAVMTAKKAARQGRHLLLLGDPGTGKSMIARAMAQILPHRRLDDVLVFPNPKDEQQPHIKTMEGGTGREAFREINHKVHRRERLFTTFEWLFAGLLVAAGIFAYFAFGGVSGLILTVMTLLVAIFFLFVTGQRRGKATKLVPNLLIERPKDTVPAPYVDATGSHAGALLGDIRHDPFQSGGLQTPVHLRVEAGAIHRANKGILFMDEINVLRLDSQQALLTAMQEKQYSITGQSDKSAGAMSRTEPVPCEFILVAAGNMDVIAPTDNRYTGLHPALRSRIRGYGYEVYVRSIMDDTDENRHKLVRFVAQEVRRDGQIPQFSRGAVAEVLREAQRRSGHTGKLTLRLRELGGLVRTAGDLARDEGRDVVEVEDVLRAKDMSMSLEYQVTRRGIEVTTSKEAHASGGSAVGTAVGCVYLGTGETGEPAGIVVPVEADALRSSHKQRGGLFVGGGLEADSSVENNVGAVLKRLRGNDMSGIDVHVQALLHQRGAFLEALGGAAAIACISALERIPVRRDTVIIGHVAVSGRLRGVDGVTQMIEGAADLGYTRAVVSSANVGDILLEHRYRDRIEVLLVDDLAEAAGHVFAGDPVARKNVQNALAGRAKTA
jgi:Lon-like ATP-dependent protease